MKKCLVVDDVEVSRYTARIFLEEMGIEVIEASDSKEALAIFETENIDVVLLDWHLKRKSGLDLLVEIREEIKLTIPVILISGVEGADKESEAKKAGANGFILKPTTSETLQSILKDVGII